MTRSDTSTVRKQPVYMPRVFYGNFDFEHELASSAYNRSNRLTRLNAELTTHLLAMARDGDHLSYPDDAPVDFLTEAARSGFPVVSTEVLESCSTDDLSMVPWGWSKAARSFAESQGWSCDAPPPDAVSKANSRMFSFESEQSLHASIPGSAVVDSMPSLEAAILNAAFVWKCRPTELCWLLKAEFSMSGRERISANGTNFEDSTENWIGRRLAAGGRLYFEPHVVPLLELSSQWSLQSRVPDDDHLREPTLLGVTQLLTDKAGQFLGSILLDQELTDAAAHDSDGFRLSRTMLDRVVTNARSVAGEVLRLGYHGPLGIDAMVYRGPDGEPAVRTIQDVNARLTMGRIALELFRRFADSGCPAWLLVPPDWLRGEGDAPAPDHSTRRLTSPHWIDGKPAQRVGVLFTDAADWTRLLAIHLRP
jgi:hypothetical protein